MLPSLPSPRPATYLPRPHLPRLRSPQPRPQPRSGVALGRRALCLRAPSGIPGPGHAGRPVRGENRDRFRARVVVGDPASGTRCRRRGPHPVDARVLPCRGRLLPHRNRWGGHRLRRRARSRFARQLLARHLRARSGLPGRLLARSRCACPGRGLRQRVPRLGLRNVVQLGRRGGLPGIVVAERQVRCVFVRVASHIRRSRLDNRARRARRPHRATHVPAKQTRRCLPRPARCPRSRPPRWLALA